MLNKFRSSKFGIAIVLVAAIKSTIILPIQQVFISASFLGFSTAATLASSGFFSSNAWADNGDNSFEDRLKTLRSQVGDISSTSKDNTANNLGSSSAENETYLLGKEEDRTYNEFHVMEEDEITDQNIKGRSGMFKSKLESDTESSEGQAYQVLKGVAQDDKFLTKDRDHQAFGDKLTFVDIESDPEFYEAYKQVRGEIQDGMVCRPVVVSPAEYSSDVITTREHCTDHNGEVWVQGECKVKRNLYIPTLQGEDISSHLKTPFTRQYSSPARVHHSFDIEILEEFSNIFNFQHSGLSGFTPDSNTDYEIKVNGEQILLGQEDAALGFNILKDKFREGSNTVETYIHPIGYIGDDLKNCMRDSWIDIGFSGGYDHALQYIYTDPTASYDPKYGNSSSISVINWNAIDYLSCGNGKLRIHRIYRADNWQNSSNLLLQLKNQKRDSGCKEIAPSSSFFYKNNSFKWINLDDKGRGYYGCAQIDLLSNRSKTLYVWPDKIKSGNTGWPRYRTEYSHPFSKAGYPFGQPVMLKPAGVKIKNCWVDKWYGNYCKESYDAVWGTGSIIKTGSENHVVRYAGRPFHCTHSSCTFNKNSANTLGLGWREDLKTELNITSSSFKEEPATEIPENCRSAKGQSYRRFDGFTVTDLTGKFLPNPDFVPDGVSNEFWRCNSFSPDRQLGLLSESKAKANEIGETISTLFPGVNSTNEQICYEADAYNLALDASRAPLCSDGTIDCYGPQEQDGVAAVIQRALNFFISQSHANQNLGLYLKADSSCEAFESASNCELVSKVCAIKSSVTGECVRYNKQYDCHEGNEVLVKQAVTKRVCETQIPCSSGDDGYCTYEVETSDSFTAAAVQLSVSTFARADQNCMSDNPDSCVIFPGEKMQCRSRVEGLMKNGNCCNEGGSVSVMDKILALYAFYKISYVESTAKMLAESSINAVGSGISSGWQYALNSSDSLATVSEWTSSAYNYAADLGGAAWNKGTEAVQGAWSGVTGAWESLVSAPADAAATQASHLVSPVGSLASQQGEQLAASTAEAGGGWGLSWVSNSVSMWGKNNLGVVGEFLFQDAVRDQATGAVMTEAQLAAGQEGVMGAVLSDAASMMLGGVMIAWQVYQIAKVINQIQIACRSNEIETSVSLKQKSCIWIESECTGSKTFGGGCGTREQRYCCFASPLARIIHEQALKTNQHPFKSEQKLYSEGFCRGFWFSEFAQLNLGHPDFSLDEWISMLMDAGQLPKPDKLDAFFSPDNLTKSTARHYDKEDEVGNAIERGNEIVGSFDDVEEIRRKQRETLLAEEKGESSWRDCGYIHDVIGGISFLGRERYASYPGRDVVLDSCEPNPDAGVFKHKYQSCPSYEREKYENIENADGTTTRKFVGMETITPKTIYFTGFNNERVVISECDDSEVALGLDDTEKDYKWVACGFEHNFGSNVSIEKFKMVALGKDSHLINECGIKPHSKRFQHEKIACDGYIFGNLDDTGASGKGYKIVFSDDSGEEKIARECEIGLFSKLNKHRWVSCGSMFHDLANKVSHERVYLAFTDDGKEVRVPGAEACSVYENAKRSYKHKWKHCGREYVQASGRYMDKYFLYFNDRNNNEIRVPGADQCAVRDTNVTYQWKSCGRELGNYGEVLPERFYLATTDSNGKEVRVEGADKCEVREGLGR